MKKIIIGSKIQPDLKRDFMELAELKNTTTSDLLEQVIRAYIKQQKTKGII